MATGLKMEPVYEHIERNQDATIYVGGLSERVTEHLLLDIFKEYGTIVNVHMPKDRATRKHQGYGFVEFAHVEEADTAIRKMNTVKLYGKAIRVNKAFVQYKQADIGANIFIGNLDPEVDEKMLFEAFGLFGPMLQSPKCMRYPDTGLSKGFAFIHYASFEAADLAIETMNGRSMCNRAITISYAFKKGSKGERHGCATERLRAAQNPIPQIQRPQVLFDNQLSVQSPSGSLMSPLNVLPPQQLTQGMQMLPMYTMPPTSVHQYSAEASYVVWPYQTQATQSFPQYPYVPQAYYTRSPIT